MGFLDTISSLAGAAGDVGVPGGGALALATKLGSKLGSFLSGKGGGVPDHERPDLVAISNTTGLTQQQVSDLCGMEESRSPANYDAIVKKYRDNPNGLLPLIDEWNSKHPDKKIVSLDSITPNYPQTVPMVVQQLAPAALVAAPVPAVVQQAPTALVAASVPATVQQSLTGGDLKDLGGAILKGGQAGASDWWLQTDAGKQAKSEGALSWAKDNFLFFLAGGIALGLLIYKAFKK